MRYSSHWCLAASRAFAGWGFPTGIDDGRLLHSRASAPRASPAAGASLTIKAPAVSTTLKR